MKAVVSRTRLGSSIGLIGLACLFYIIYEYNAFTIRMVEFRRHKPSHSSNQINIMFKIIADISGDQQAIVNFDKNGNGKYFLPGENYTFDYQIVPTNFEALSRVKNVITQRAVSRSEKPKWSGYLRVHRFGEELSKQMRIFLGLPNFPGFQNMKIVAPNFLRGSALSKGPTPFDAIYNLRQLNQAFAKNGYPPIVLDKEYVEVCKNTPKIYMISFLPAKTRCNYNGCTKEVLEKLYGKHGTDKSERWVDCDLGRYVDAIFINVTERRMICTTWRFNIATLRQSILKDAKCIEILSWADHGAYKTRANLNSLTSDEIFNYVLNPSDMIVKEVDTFIERYLERPYVAVHIRANHINTFPSTVNRCYKLAMSIVDVLKVRMGVKSIYITSDLNKFGGQGSYTPGHEEYLAAISGAVRYRPNATGQLTDISRTSISITNVLLVRKSDHLVAIGTGSFHGFIMGQFLREHFEKDPKTWSMIRMCENARAPGMTRDPNADYSKYIED